MMLKLIQRFYDRVRPLPPFAKRMSDPLIADTVILPRNPLISVVMTSYNTGPWIESAIRSVLGQTWRNLELILVDDASNDDTVVIARQLQRDDSRLKIIEGSENVGTYIAKNKGMMRAAGDVITFMDSDDLLKPDRLLNQVDLLRHPGIVATTCNYIRTDEDGNIVSNRGLEQRQALISLMIKRQVIDDVGAFDPVRIAADDEFFERIRLVYGRSAHRNLAQPAYIALVRASSLSQQTNRGVRLYSDEATSALSPPRSDYQNSYGEWHRSLLKQGCRPYIDPHNADARPFSVMPEITHPLRHK